MEALETTLAERFDLYGCFQCGRCTGGCPVALKSKLNIRKLMIEGLLGRHLDRLAERDELWDCTTCKTCTLRCPRGLKPMDLVIGLRGSLVEEGHIPKTVIEALESTYKHGNPWGKAKNRRNEWTKELPKEIEIKDLSQGERARFLYFAGCTASFDPRIQKVARSLVLLFTQAGVDFAIMGNEEQCCGSEIRRMGEAGLFEMLVEENVQRFESYGVERIMTGCPHGLNALKNEYPSGKFEVSHTTEVLARCVEEGRLSFRHEVKKVATYHDPCFLGKQNGLFDPPRLLLEAVPGLTLRELDRSRERSLCCEGGGGRMWAESSSEVGERLAQIRVRDAVALGAEILVTACPLCVLTLEDAVKTSGHEEKIEVLDVAELLVQAL